MAGIVCRSSTQTRNT